MLLIKMYHLALQICKIETALEYTIFYLTLSILFIVFSVTHILCMFIKTSGAFNTQSQNSFRFSGSSLRLVESQRMLHGGIKVV